MKKRKRPSSGRRPPAAREAFISTLKKEAQAAGFEVLHRTTFSFGGWTLLVEPAFQPQPALQPNILYIEDEAQDRGISFSSMQLVPKEGWPFEPNQMLEYFPPREYLGRHYEHETPQLKSRALWMFGESDDPEATCWLLTAFMVLQAPPYKAGHVTITTPRESDLGWALETWRNIVYVPGHEHEVGVLPPSK